MHLRMRIQILHQPNELPQRLLLLRRSRHHQLRRRQMPAQNIPNPFPLHPAARLQYHVLHPPLDLKKYRRLPMLRIIPYPQFEPILVPVHRPPINLPVIRIQIKTVHRIRQIRLPHTKLIQLQILRNKSADLQRHFIWDEILQLKPRRH